MSKNKRRAPKIGTVLMFITFLAVFAVSASKVIPYFMESRKAESAYDELRGSFAAKPAETPEPAKTQAPVTAAPEPEVTAVPVTATPEPTAEATATATATPETTEIPEAVLNATAALAIDPAEAPAQTAEPSRAVASETAPEPAFESPETAMQDSSEPVTVTAEPTAEAAFTAQITAVPIAAPEATASPIIIEETPAPTAEAALSPAATRAPKTFHTVTRPERAKPKVRRVSMDFDELQKKGKRIVAWITCNDTAIDYPVVHGWNNEYYLDHLWNGEQNTHGTIFMDYMNSGKVDERNTVLYGHHMKDGSMFATLDKYKDQSFFEKHPTMTLYTPEGDYLVEIVSGTIEDGNYAFVRFTFQNDEAFTEYVAGLKRRSVFKSDVQVEPTDRLLTLCTCSYEESNARFMVTGRLVPIYE